MTTASKKISEEALTGAGGVGGLREALGRDEGERGREQQPLLLVAHPSASLSIGLESERVPGLLTLKLQEQELQLSLRGLMLTHSDQL
jgi:hypothetical protein